MSGDLEFVFCMYPLLNSISIQQRPLNSNSLKHFLIEAMIFSNLRWVQKKLFENLGLEKCNLNSTSQKKSQIYFELSVFIIHQYHSLLLIIKMGVVSSISLPRSPCFSTARWFVRSLACGRASRGLQFDGFGRRRRIVIVEVEIQRPFAMMNRLWIIIWAL